MHVAWILAGWLACAFTALAMGLVLFRLLRLSLDRAESICLGYIAGSAALSFLVFFIAAAGLARKGVFLALACAAIAALLYFRRALLPPARQQTPSISIWWWLLFAAGMLAFGVLYFRQALSPEMSSDAMEYHLGLINQFNQAHRMVRFEDMYAALPQGVEMLFFFAFAIGKHSAAALIHFTFLLDLALLLALYGRRFGFDAAGIVAALLVFASPQVGSDGTAAYNDVALACVMFAALYLLSLWRREKTGGMLIACCAVTGFALAVKYTAVYFVAFVVLAIAVGLFGKHWRELRLAAALAAVLLAVSVAPYIVRNAIWFQNPLAFFGNAIFRNPHFHVSFEQNYRNGMAHWHDLQWSEMPLQLTLGGPRVDGLLGVAFLAAPLALAGVFWPQSRVVVFAALAAALSFPQNRTVRFLIPALPFIALAMAWVLRRIPGWRVLLAAIALVQIVASWPSFVARHYRFPGWSLQPVPWRVALRETPEDAWLSERSERYVITRDIDRLVPRGQPILTLGSQLARSYTDRPTLVYFQSAFGEKLGDMFITYWISPSSGQKRWQFRFPAVSARDVQIVQTGSGILTQWSVNEVQLESSGKVLLPGSGAHPYAWPNPWDAGLAFDGIAVSRWRTWEPMRPGMRLGLRFDQPVSLDGLAVVSFADEWDSRLSLRVLTEAGKWIEEPAPALDMIPPADLRRQAMQEIRRQGVQYVLIAPTDWNGRMLIAEAGQWGLTPVIRTPNYALFRIEP
ncbi:MAG TPA: glycosyltransferase family 39 protein [Bryobacteraceae bacterium]|nr:glycosyltransferase family 39 protein [Bryobacteraceae bacterium]